MTELSKLHIAVLMGGWANERPVSLMSGEGVAKALEQRGVHGLADTMSVDAEWQVLRGSSTGTDIARFAAEMEAGLIVMATHGRSAIGRVALGSTAMSIMGRSPCPVLLRRPPSVALDPPTDDDG